MLSVNRIISLRYNVVHSLLYPVHANCNSHMVIVVSTELVCLSTEEWQQTGILELVDKKLSLLWGIRQLDRKCGITSLDGITLTWFRYLNCEDTYTYIILTFIATLKQHVLINATFNASQSWFSQPFCSTVFSFRVYNILGLYRISLDNCALPHCI